MSKKLAIKLSKLKVFSNPKIKLEQYPTDSNVAADFLWNAYLLKDIEDKTVADFGAGTGILSIGCVELNAKKIFAVEKDIDAIEILKENTSNETIEIVHDDVTNFEKEVDTVFMNPPFGTKQRKADKKFVQTAMKCANTIYYLGKIEAKPFIETISKQNGYKITHVWEYNMQLKQTMAHHRSKLKRIEVACWRLHK